MSIALTVHVLDVYHGESADNMLVEVSCANETVLPAIPMAKCETNKGGRTDAPLLENDEFLRGRYKCRFHVGDYFNRKGVKLEEPRFIDVVDIDFGANGEESYHLPLLVTPWSYSVYRGS